MEITREKLYEELWNEGITKVVVKYSLTYQAVHKKCKEYNIPLPSKNYWGSLNSGKSPTPDPLPQYEGNTTITFKEKVEPKQYIPFRGYDENRRKQLLDIQSSLKIDEVLTNPHPAIVAHRAVAKPDNIKYRSQNDLGYDIDYKSREKLLKTGQIIIETMPKAYLFLDALLKALEKADVILDLTQRRTHFIVDNEIVIMDFKEKKCRNKIPIKERNHFDYFYTPSGFIKILIGHESVYDLNNRVHYSEFIETKTNSLEILIKDIFAYILDQPYYINMEREWLKQHLEEQRLIDIEEMRLKEIHDKEQKRLKDIHDEEFNKTQSLIILAKQFELSEIIERFINNLEHSEADIDQEYIEWAKRKANWLSPINNQTDDLLNNYDKDALVIDKEDPKEPNIWKLDSYLYNQAGYHNRTRY